MVSVYVIAFVVGRFFDTLAFTRAKASLAFGVMCIAFGMRLVARYFFDGTVFYERIACTYTQGLAAFCVFYLFIVVFQNVAPPKWVSFIGEISFEVYLVHYMFCVGPVKVFGLTPCWLMDCLMTTAISIVFAVIIHKVSHFVSRKLK